jgi:hypothetical protein
MQCLTVMSSQTENNWNSQFAFRVNVTRSEELSYSETAISDSNENQGKNVDKESTGTLAVCNNNRLV